MWRWLLPALHTLGIRRQHAKIAHAFNARVPWAITSFAAVYGLSASLASNAGSSRAASLAQLPRTSTSAQSSVRAVAKGPSFITIRKRDGKPEQAEAAAWITQLASDSKALDALQSFLSPDNLTSPTPRKHTANTLKSLYISVKAREQLQNFGADALSQLICAFGVLSTRSDRSPPFSTPHTSNVVGHVAPEGYGSFVHQLVQDKKRHGMLVSESDMYWVMRTKVSSLEAALRCNACSIRIQGGHWHPRYCRHVVYRHDIHDEIARVICDYLKNARPPASLIPVLQCITARLVSVGAGCQCLRIVNSILRCDSALLDPSFIHHCLRQLLRSRQLHTAARLLDAVCDVFPQHQRKWRLYITMGAYRRGASRVARSTFRRVESTQRLARSAADIAHSVDFRSPATPVSTLKLSGFLKKEIGALSNRELHTTLRVLLSAGRSSAAKSLVLRHVPRLDQRTNASLCNSYLSWTLARSRPRNARLMRKVLRLLDLFVQRCGFTPDRVTVNLLLKAMIQWHGLLDAPKLRALFDHMVRSGYPTGRGDHVPPFGTSAAGGQVGFNIPRLPKGISFAKHVRPMYKQFVKGFYLRGDVDAAKTVVGILKVEEQVSEVERMWRTKARRAGRIAKGEKV